MSAETVKVLEDAYAAFGRGDVPAVLAAFDEEISWTVSDMLPFGGEFKGHAGVTGFCGSLGDHFTSLSVEPEEFIDGGDTIVVPSATGARPRAARRTSWSRTSGACATGGRSRSARSATPRACCRSSGSPRRPSRRDLPSARARAAPRRRRRPTG